MVGSLFRALDAGGLSGDVIQSIGFQLFYLALVSSAALSPLSRPPSSERLAGRALGRNGRS